MAITTAVFDAYGTLFDVGGAARLAAEEPGMERLADAWPKLAADWRDRQLQYTWLRTITGVHADLWHVTKDSLDWALEANGLADAGLRERLLALYRSLPAYPEVPATLRELREAGITCAILSNGTPDMLSDATAAAGLSEMFDALLSVESVGVFKPDDRVYDLVGARFGTRPHEVLFVSSNGWDAAGAAGYGFHTLWVNRGGAPVERLPAVPDLVRSDLTGLAAIARTGVTREAQPRSPAQFFTSDDGLRLAYRDSGSGVPLLCIPGLTRNMSDFDFVERDFADRARIIRCDLRGRGESEFDADYRNYNTLREGRDVLALLDHLGIEKTAILGTSRGGLIAMGLAAGHCDRLLGVCLNDIGPMVQPEGLAHIFSYLGIVPKYLNYDEAAAELVKNTAKTFPGVPRSRWRLHAERIWKETGAGLELRYDTRLRRAVMEQSAGDSLPDLWPLWEALLPLPVTVIRGQYSDILSAETAAEMRRRKPDLVVVEVPNRGHVPFLDEPESRRAIRGFLDQLAQRADTRRDAAAPVAAG